MMLGTLVMVVVDKPDGCYNVHVCGQIGVITEIYRYHDGVYDYTVRNKFGEEYIYGSDEIRELTDKECRDVLYEMLTDFTAKGERHGTVDLCKAL